MIIAFEGIDGSGKTTAVEAIADWLINLGFEVAIMRWTSFLGDTANETTPFEQAHRLKSGHEMGPLSFALWHCADFAHRWETTARPALDRDTVVLSDRYKYSGLVRGIARGIDETYLRYIYKFAPDADCVLYLDIDPATALRRKIESDDRTGFYESGHDLYPDLDRADAFLAFQKRCQALYPRVLPEVGVARMNASLPAEDVTQAIKTEISRITDIREVG